MNNGTCVAFRAPEHHSDEFKCRRCLSGEYADAHCPSCPRGQRTPDRGTDVPPQAAERSPDRSESTPVVSLLGPDCNPASPPSVPPVFWSECSLHSTRSSSSRKVRSAASLVNATPSGRFVLAPALRMLVCVGGFPDSGWAGRWSSEGGGPPQNALARGAVRWRTLDPPHGSVLSMSRSAAAAAAAFGPVPLDPSVVRNLKPPTHVS
ncbi:hypothetical protein EYF80_056423 [Liparis tanakae]|uniref:Uncharacterized protein n=1 Tax=Liparis tanakae TaxID=230148 RepID=A0A4Z2EWT3_9TELE|nr:hypothetical protein EYF80_056423 [Liparis tanakae]